MSNEANLILSNIDQSEPLKTCSEIAGEIDAIIAGSGPNTEGLRQLLKNDWLACALVTRALIAYPQEPDNSGKLDRITGYGGRPDGSTFPDPAQLTQDDLDYLTGRAAETGNFVIKAQYYHLAFALAAKKKRENAQSAIDAYLESAQRFAGSNRRNREIDAICELDQAVYLALQVQDNVRLKSIVFYIAESLRVEPQDRRSLDGKPQPVGRFLYDLSILLLYIAGHKSGNVVTEGLLQLVEDRMSAMVERNAADNMHMLNHQLLDAAQRAALLRKNPERAYKLSADRIESLVKQAQAPDGGNGAGNLVRGSYYEDAIDQYEVLRGMTGTTGEQRSIIDTRVNELRLLLKAAYRAAREGNEYRLLSVEDEIDTEEHDAMINELLASADLNTCLDEIVSEGSLLPNVASARGQAELASIDAPLQAMIPRIHISDDIPVAHSINDAERLADAADQNVKQWIQINTASILVPLVERLISEKRLNVEALVAYFERWGRASEQDIEFLHLGFRHYIAADHTSALHVLVPRYEALLRGVFEAGGTAAFRSRRTQAGSEAETLGSFLSKPAVKSTLSEDLHAYIRIVLAEQRGWNLRNRIAHGLITLQECTVLESTVIIHLLLLLTTIPIPITETTGG